MKLYKELKVSFFVLLSTSLLILACDSKSPVETNDEIGTEIFLVSECGGFDSASKKALGNIPFLHDAEKYCDAERLHWLYDENTKTLKVMNSRILLNCCGDHEITASSDNGSIVINENDQPVDGKGRCRCVCVFDFYIEISGVLKGEKTLKLVLTVDDDTSDKWEGKIDIRQGNGVIIIDDKPLAYGCP